MEQMEKIHYKEKKDTTKQGLSYGFFCSSFTA
jgi:hypothetical protein